jgi:CRISPR-associated endonuclease/helicase Cas3
MCPAHRSERIQEMRWRLQAKERCLVVSTQVIEAGVDVDFPVVFRAMAGLDSIAQAAGRCNREGRLDQGRVYVFESDCPGTPEIKQAAFTTGELIRQYDDLLSPAAIEAYFRLHYWKHEPRDKRWDDPDVMACFPRPTTHNFKKAASRFQWIKEQTHSIIVPWEKEGREICDALLKDEHSSKDLSRLLRLAQQYAVSVYPHLLDQLYNNTVVTPHPRFERLWILTNPNAYDPQIGLHMDVAGMDPSLLQA